MNRHGLFRVARRDARACECRYRDWCVKSEERRPNARPCGGSIAAVGAPSEWRRREQRLERSFGACAVLSKSPTGHTQGTQLHPREELLYNKPFPSLSSRRRSLDRAGSWFSLRARTATLHSVSRLSPLTYRFLRYAPATLSHTLIAQTSLAPVARPTPPGTIKQQKCTQT